jgi:hypothetical protein
MLELDNREATQDEGSPALASKGRAARAAPGGSTPVDTLNPLFRLPVLAVGALAGLVIASLLVPNGALSAEPELLRIIRAMALIKGAMLVAALALLLWRCNEPLPLRPAGLYCLGTALAAAGCMAIWKVSFIGFSSVAFYAGVALLGVGALREHLHSSATTEANR